MKNLQEEQVFLVKNLCNGKDRIRVRVLNKLLENAEFLAYFKKRLRFLGSMESNAETNYLLEKIDEIDSTEKMVELLSGDCTFAIKKLRSLLIRSYLEHKQGFDITKVSPLRLRE